MQNVVEEEVYAVHGHFSGDKDDIIFLKLDKNKISEIEKKLRQIDRKDFIDVVENPLRGKVHAYKSFYLGYFSTDQVASYYCSKCNEEYNEKPIQKIFITLPNNTFPDHIGQFILRCNHCDNYILFLDSGVIKEGEKIDVKYIVDDNRGLFIPKTEKDVNNSLEKLLEESKEGPSSINGFNLELIKYWANNLKIDISQKLSEIEKVREESYFRNYQEDLPNTIRILEEKAEFASFYPVILNENAGGEVSYEEGTDFLEIWEEFVKYLPNLTLTSELKERVLTIIKTIKGNMGDNSENIRKEMEEKKKMYDDAIKEQAETLEEFNSLEKLVQSK